MAASSLNSAVIFSSILGSKSSVEKGEADAKRFFWLGVIDFGSRLK